MLKSFFSNFFRPSICSLVCILGQSVSSQEVIDIVVDTSVENLDAESPYDFDEFETLTRGPLHEAFAEPIVADPVPGLIVAIEPPPPINELMPEFRPDGDDAIWIAGYWGWDSQREDFIWISGVYRVPPPGHQWVPGYWHQVSDGWQWGQGFWVEEIAESIAYYPPPPATLENGPSSPSPGIDYFYIPGHWSQSSDGFAWNSGYWHPLQDDLVWVPAHTIWTPRGCVYIAGYWDQRLPLRGLCFAPVYVSRVIYSRPGWYLRPSVVLNAQTVLQNLFVQPGYNHYLFGDYYGTRAANWNVLPAYVYHQRRGSYDPLISFYSAYNARQGQDFIRWYGNHYADLNRNPGKRPAQNWSSVTANGGSGANAFVNQSVQLAYSLDQVNKISSGLRVSPISEDFRQNNLKRDNERKQIARDRALSERNTDASGVATFVLPRLESTPRRNVLNSKLGKLPEPPRYTPSNAARNAPRNNDILSLKPADNQLRGNLNLNGNDLQRLNPSMRSENSAPFQSGRIAPEVTRRIESIPKNLEPNRGGNRDSRSGVPNDGTAQPGRISPLNQSGTLNSPRTLEVPREPNRFDNNKPNRNEPNRIEANKPDPFGPNRNEPNRNEASKPNRNEPGRIEANKPDPFGPNRNEPNRNEANKPNRNEPNRNEPSRLEGNRPNPLGPNRIEPNRNEADKPNRPNFLGPNRNKPNGSEPNGNKPNGNEPNRSEPNRSEPNRNSLNRNEANKPNRSEPNRVEPSRIKEQSRPMEQPKMQIPPPQPPTGNRPPMTESRNRKNAPAETRSTPPTAPGAGPGKGSPKDRENPPQNDAGKKPKQ